MINDMDEFEVKEANGASDLGTDGMETKYVPGLQFSLTCEVSNRKGHYERIVDDVGAKVPLGSMLAILGPSGSGKSTLLQCITRRGPVFRDKKKFRVTGPLSWKGSEVSSKKFHRQCGFVTQEELFFAQLTVKETLLTAAALRMRSDVSFKDRKKTVEKLIDQLQLRGCEKTKVGDERQKGISGGERKRLNIACELISAPEIICLDEPTSGLDSASASRVVNVLRNLQMDGKTIIAVVHQPRWLLLESFQQIMILLKGTNIYTGSPSNLEEFFLKFGVTFPKGENTMDVVFDAINGENVDSNVVDSLISAAKNNTVIVSKSDLKKSSDTDRKNEMNPWFYTFRVLIYRFMIEKLKDPIVVQSQIVFAIMFAILQGIVFFQLGYDPAAIQSRVGSLTFAVLLQSFMTFDIILLFPKERAIYLRETGQSLYTPSAFFMSRTLAELPNHCLVSFIFAIICFYMVGLRNFGMFLLTVELATNCGASLLLFVSAISKNLEVANVVASLFLVLFFLFDGFYIRTSQIPIYLRWMSEFSFLGIAATAAIKNELDGIPVHVDVNLTDSFTQPFLDAETAQIFFEVDDLTVKEQLLKLLGYILGYRVVAFLGLKYLYTK